MNQCDEALTRDQSYRYLFSFFSWKNTEVAYCDSCHSSKYLLGCVGLQKGDYRILNKQYSKEAYEELKARIIEHMKKTGEWSEFFPAELSRFGYNESVAQMSYPLTNDEAIAKGFRWRTALQFTVGKETIAMSHVPDSIRDVPDSITSETLACSTCSRNYRIIPQELRFYKNMGIPLPRQCFHCRNAARIALRNPFKLWPRACQCAGTHSDNTVYINQTAHFHKDQHCPNSFETSYTPTRPEVVYCDQCYLEELG